VDAALPGGAGAEFCDGPPRSRRRWSSRTSKFGGRRKLRRQRSQSRALVVAEGTQVSRDRPGSRHAQPLSQGGHVGEVTRGTGQGHPRLLTFRH
jgi:hypothetical protein